MLHSMFGHRRGVDCVERLKRRDWPTLKHSVEGYYGSVLNYPKLKVTIPEKSLTWNANPGSQETKTVV